MSRITVASAKNKARRLQQWVRDEILGTFRVFRPEDVKSTSMGVTGEDIQLSPFARDFLPVQIECKAHKHFAIYNVYEQAQTHGGYEPIVFIRGDRKKPLAVVDAQLLVKMMYEYSRNGEWGN